MKKFYNYRYLLLCIYLVYSVSPLIGYSSEKEFFTHVKSPSIRIFILDELLSVLWEPGENELTSDADIGDEFLVKKLRCLPRGHCLGKNIFNESHVCVRNHLIQEVALFCNEHPVIHTFTNDPVPAPLKGYDTIHSGLAPPYLLS